MILSTSLSVPLPLQPMITIYNIRKVAVLAIGLAIFFRSLSILNISNPEGTGKNVRDSQSSRYREIGLKEQPKKTLDVFYLQLHFHITNDIP